MEGVMASIDRIHKEVANSFFIYNNEVIELTITIGVCPSGQYSSYQDIILEADRRLYDGKHRGKNCVVYNAPLTI
jgi:GGDEF domain-containing protein